MKKVIIIILFFNLSFLTSSFAQTSASQLQRTQEIIIQEEALRKKLQEPQKVFIKSIMVEGVTLISQEKIQEIISPFLKRWLTQTDIQQVEEAIKEAYKKKGYIKHPAEISHQIKKKSLIIKVKE